MGYLRSSVPVGSEAAFKVGPNVPRSAVMGWDAMR